MTMNTRGWRTPGALLVLGMVGLVPVQAAEQLERGEIIAREGNGRGGVACMSCHGLEGEGDAAGGFPRLAGMPEAYLAKQLRDYSDGSRESPIMTPFAGTLSDTDLQAVAAYYASLEAFELPTAYRAADPGDAAEWLAKRGDWEATIPACNQCHGPNGQGVGESFPPLAGQHAGYLAAQLEAWREGSRQNDPDGLMAGVASRLSDAQIAAITDYYATLPARLEGGGPEAGDPAPQEEGQ